MKSASCTSLCLHDKTHCLLVAQHALRSCTLRGLPMRRRDRPSSSMGLYDWLLIQGSDGRWDGLLGGGRYLLPIPCRLYNPASPVSHWCTPLRKPLMSAKKVNPSSGVRSAAPLRTGYAILATLANSPRHLPCRSVAEPQPPSLACERATFFFFVVNQCTLYIENKGQTGITFIIARCHLGHAQPAKPRFAGLYLKATPHAQFLRPAHGGSSVVQCNPIATMRDANWLVKKMAAVR
jgi:hypothetical protein